MSNGGTIFSYLLLEDGQFYILYEDTGRIILEKSGLGLWVEQPAIACPWSEAVAADCTWTEQ